MKLPQMRTGLVISLVGHAALLLWGLISFAVKPLAAPPTDAILTDVITTSEFAQLTKGAKNAPKAETPAPVVDKQGEQRQSDEVVANVSEKPEIKTQSAPPPLPPSRPADAKPDKKPPPKTDPIADALKREEARKAAEAKAKAAQQKQMPPPPRFDPTQIAALLDTREPNRQAAMDEAIMPAPPSLGTRTGSAPKLSQSELEAMRAKLMKLWNPPTGVQNPEELIVTVVIRLSRDGRLAGPMLARSNSQSPIGQAARERALHAIMAGQPFDMLSPATYDSWKEIEIKFDPRDMYRG